MAVQSVASFQNALVRRADLEKQGKHVKTEIGIFARELKSIGNKLVERKESVKEYKEEISVLAKLTSQLQNISSDKWLRLKHYNDGSFKLKPAAYSGINLFKHISPPSRYRSETVDLIYKFDYHKPGALTRHNLGGVISSLEKHGHMVIGALQETIGELTTSRDRIEEKKSRLDDKLQVLFEKVDAEAAIADPPVKLAHFLTVYSTNEGCTAINRSLRTGKDSPPSKSGVIREIERIHGNDQFTRGAKQVKADIQEAASKLTLANISDVDNFLYAKGLNQPRPGTFYRGISLSQNGLARLQQYREEGVRVKPDGLFSCDSSKAMAKVFADKHTTTGQRTIIRIDGQTQQRMTSGLTAKGEQESIFSTNAAFEIKRISQQNIAAKTYVVVELVEVIPTGPLISGQKFPH
jgi:hypothetical protein